MASLPDVRLTPKGTARARGGHPWIFRVDVAAAPPPDADEVRVTDDRGRVLGSALAAAPPAPIALRMYAYGDRHVRFDDVWPERLDRALALRAERFAGVSACRLVHGEGDLLPGLFVDRYGDAAVVQSGTAAMDRREGAIAAALAERLPLRLVVARDDGSMRDHEELPRRKQVLHGAGPTLVRMTEGAATFELDLLADSKTGSFLDQRENHAHAGTLARGEALDAFTYHGGFALALAARAERVLAIDEDPAAIERARRNAQLSGRGNVEFRAADAFAVLRELEGAGRRFDVVVVDPPALAKRKGAVATALRAYHELNLRALRLTRPGGWLITCSCSGRVTAELFGDMLVKAARDAHRQASIVDRRGAGADHPVLLGVPETEYLKCWTLRVH